MSVETLRETHVTIEKLLERIQKHFPQGDLELVKRAYAFAEKHYAHIVHPTGKSYIHYVSEVAIILADLHSDATTISAAMISPPSPVTGKVLDDLKKHFKVEKGLVNLVEELLCLGQLEWDVWSTASGQTESRERKEILQKMFCLAIDEVKSEGQEENFLTVIHFRQKKEKQVENLIRMFLAATTDIRTLIIKLAEQLLFIKLLKDLPQTQKNLLHYTLFAKITLTIYAPLADRLGMWWLKSELEDMSFRLLQPDKYMAIVKQLAAKKKEREKDIDDIIPIIRSELKAYGGIIAEISGRAKHIYSIYQKMEAKQLTFQQINDLLGIRIIVDTPEDCYNTQGILHEFWPPLTEVYDGKAGRDWIAHPKENQYQSLHTTIIIKDKIVEVQIRTRTMHEIAEYGIAAAHWLYKQNKAYRKGKTSKGAGTKDQDLTKQLAELRKNFAYEQETAASKLLKDRIFVITPEGHVIDLPAGATPLDFAYRIHTDLGHGYTGAKVSNHLVRLDYELKNGEIVELLTSRARKGPSLEWLSISRDKNGKSNYVFARMQQTRSKIRKWFNEQNNMQKSRQNEAQKPKLQK
jgi:guanosine-3',5'-bis(diphosphate) 3'-pyrophosphohydrolase